MKKLVLLIAIVLAAYVGFGQATPSGQLRVAAFNTVFGVSVPVGTQVYCVATGRQYTCITATPSTGDLATNITNFRLTSNYAAPATALSSGDSVATYNRTTGQYEMKKITFGTGAGSVTSVSAGFGMNFTTITTTGSVAVDTTVMVTQKDTATVGGKIATKYNVAQKLDKSLTSAQIFVGNGSNVAAGVAMSGDATIANTGAVTVTQSAGNFKVKGTLAIATPSVGTSADSILVVNGGNVKRVASSLFVTTANVKTAVVEDYEKATADSAAGYCVRLGHTPLAGTIAVMYNGGAVPASKFSIVSTSKLFVALPSYQYDKVTVSYSY